MAIQFIVKDANGSIEIDLSNRNAIMADVFSVNLQNGPQPVLVMKLGVSTGVTRYWAFIEPPDLMGKRYSASSTPAKKMIYPTVTAMAVTKEELSISSSSAYQNIASQMVSGFYYLVVIDERLTGLTYDKPVNITVGTY